MRFNPIDISTEMFIHPSGQGVVLANPTKLLSKKIPTVESLLKLPFNVYFIKHDGTNVVTRT